MNYWKQLFLAVFFGCKALCSQFDFDILGELYPEDFFQAPSFGAVTLSPSGEKYIYTSHESNNQNFYVVDTKTQKKEPYFGTDADKAVINYIAWKDEDRIIFQAEHGNVYLLNLKDHKRTLLFDSERLFVGYFAVIWGNFSVPKVISILPDELDGILVSAYDKNGIRQVYRIDLKTAENKILFKNSKRFDAFYADLNGHVRMAMKYTSRTLEFYYRPGDSNKWIPFDKVFKKEDDSGFDLNKSNVTQRRDYFLGFDFNPDQFYFASNRIKDTTTIYKYDMASQQLLEEVAHDPDYDFVDVTEISAFHFVSSKRRSWVGFFCNRDVPYVYWVDPFFQDLQKKVDDHLSESHNLIVNWNQDETIFMINTTSGNRPTGFYLYDLQADTMKLIGNANSALLEVETPDAQPIKYSSRDGLEIEGYFTPGKSEKSESVCPLVVLVHGGPWMRDSYTYDPVVQWLSYNGFSVLQVNYRGSTGYGYDHFIAMKNDFGLGVLDDLEDGLNWVVKKGMAEPDRVAIMGMSYGGYASLLALTKKPEIFKCGVAMSGIYDLIESSKTLKKESNKGLSYESWRTMVGQEWRDRERLRDISPVNHVERLSKPLFLVHGKLDPIVAFRQVELLIDALEEAGKDFEFMEIPDEGHGIVQPKNQALIFEAVVDFLNSHLAL